MSVVLVPKYHRIGEGFTAREQATAAMHPGRRTDGTQSAASWVLDLVDTKHVLLLCAFCRGKFNPRRFGYRRFYCPDPTASTDGYQANGACDACKAPTINAGGGTAFVSEETYGLVNVDPADVRRRARFRSENAWARDEFRQRQSRKWRLAQWLTDRWSSATRRAAEAAGRKD